MPNELVKQISYVLYKADEEDVKVNVLLKDESIWLTQKSMAELFDCSTDNIGLHLKKYFYLWRIGKKFSYRGILGNCFRWEKLQNDILQS